MYKGPDLKDYFVELGIWSTHGKHSTGANATSQSYNYGGIPFRAYAALAGFRSVNGIVAYELSSYRDTIVAPPVLKNAYAGRLKNHIETLLHKWSKRNTWPQGLNDSVGLAAFVKVLDYFADFFWQDAAHLCALDGENEKSTFERLIFEVVFPNFCLLDIGIQQI